jgi:aryl-alcohol dehydrogenase-like predicted oxidoreductase
VPAHATEKGTRNYAARFPRLASGHFRNALSLSLSSLGIGTYLGEADAETDTAYAESLRRALAKGCNVIDTAINYRFQRSERSVGAALNELFSSGTVSREQVFVATKGGYIPFDGGPPRDPSRWFYDAFVKTGIASERDLVAGCHCMTPAYLRNQLDTSLRNLQLQTVDLYYVHNPETQLAEVTRDEFAARLRAAFASLEEAVGEGKIRCYGLATWNGFRQSPQSRDYLSLADAVAVAEQVAGRSHHFRAIQLPHNLAMPEAFARSNQQLDGEALSTLAAARRLGVTAVASASVLQGQLSRRLPEELGAVIDGFESDAQRAIQFVRSTPGVATALVGMKTLAHVEENLAIASQPPLSEERFMSLFDSGS